MDDRAERGNDHQKGLNLVACTFYYAYVPFFTENLRYLRARRISFTVSQSLSDSGLLRLYGRRDIKA